MSELDIIAVDDLPVGALKLVKAGGKRLLVTRTERSLLVTDNACPHEGYGLVQGDVGEDSLTCTWHNWKFRLSDGRCVLGEEDLRTYPARIENGRIVADLADPPNEELRPRLFASLRRGIDDGYVGQMSRDVVRLLRADADPVQLAWEAVAWGAPRAEFGFGHAMASLTDCLSLAKVAKGDARALPIVQALAGVTEVERRRPVRPQPAAVPLPPHPARDFRAAVGAEDLERAEALVLGALAADMGPDDLRPWFVSIATDHLLGYGHGAIYVQKAFELVDLLGWERASTVLPHLVPALGGMTREDRLPYLRPFVRSLGAVDLRAMADSERSAGWVDDGTLQAALLSGPGADLPGIMAGTAIGGAGVEGVLDAVVAAASERLLRYDPHVEHDDDVDFGWLDITHGLTYAHAARWAWRTTPGPDTARLALWTSFLVLYGGRKGWAEVREPFGAPVGADPAELAQAALSDTAGSFIVSAHLVKTACAAIAEAEIIGSDAPRSGAARFIASPRRERFVALNVRKAIDVADGKVPS